MKRLLAVAASASAALGPAEAHLVDARFGDFFGGALHLATALPYALIFLSACLLCALHGLTTARAVVIALPGAMLAGGLFAQPVALASLPLLVAAVAAGLGALLALGRTIPRGQLIGLLAVAGGIIGFENGLATSTGVDAPLFLAGATAAGLTIVSLLTAVARRLAEGPSWSRVAFRAVGSWCLAVSVVLIALDGTGGMGGG